MVQFLSINFFLDFFNFCWVFQKFPFFCVPCIKVKKALLFAHVKFMLYRTNAVRLLAWSQWWKDTEILHIPEREHTCSLPTIKFHESPPIR